MTQVTANPRFLGDGNTQGTVLGTGSGQSPAGKDSAGNPEKIALYGATTPVAQRGGAPQAALTRGQQAGSITIYNSTQSPSSVLTITTTEKSLTVQNGTGFAAQITAGDMLYVNKPTSQAGLGVGNIRVSAANVAGLTLSNFTGATITPTASEVYGIVAIRGMGNLSATLSPAAVLANTIVEQQFTVAGLVVGQMVQVIKPTAQAGLDIMGCRVVSDKVLGITFGNVTAATITPTTAESYTILALGGLDAVNNDLLFGFNVGTVGAISAGVVISGGSTTLTGVLATDTVAGIFKPTPQATATNIATPIYGIPTANTMTLYFLGTGTGSTPTASEIYGIKIHRLAPAAPLVIYAVSLAPVAVAANTTAEQTFTVTGLISGTAVWVNKPTATGGLGICGVRVSATNTLAINYGNVTAAAITPPTEIYLVGNFQVPLPGTGNAVSQAAVGIVDKMGTLANEVRTSLVNLGAIVGS